MDYTGGNEKEDVMSVDATNVVSVRTDGDFAGAATKADGVSAQGKTDLVQIQGNPSKTWQNVFMLTTSNYKALGYKYVSFEIYFTRGSDSFVGMFGSDGNPVLITIDQAVNDAEVGVYNSNGQKTNFAENTWLTIVVDIDAFASGIIQFYSLGGFNAYIGNLSFMTADGYQDFIAE